MPWNVPLERPVAGDRAAADATLMQCVPLLETQNWQAALDLLHRANEQDPAHPRVHFLLAQVRRSLPKLDLMEALHDARLANLLEPSWADARALEGHLRHLVGDAEGALALLQDLDPEPLPAALRADRADTLGSIAMERGDLVEARAHLEEAKRVAPRRPEIALHLARLCQREGDVDGQRAELERAAALAPLAVAVRYELARLHRRLGNDEEAERQHRLHELLGSLEDDSSSMLRNDPERRAEVWREVRSLLPRAVEPALELMRTLRGSAKPPQIAKEGQAILADGVDSAEIRYLTATALARTGDYDAAAAVAESVTPPPARQSLLQEIERIRQRRAERKRNDEEGDGP